MPMFVGADFGLLNWLPGAVRVAYTASDPGPDPLPVGAPSRPDRDHVANAPGLWRHLEANDSGMRVEGTKPGKRVWAVVLVLATQTLLVPPDLMPAYSEINPFDETKYIESGRLLLAGELRELAWGPLVALVYGPFYLIFGSLPDWFMISLWSGRILLFLALWLSSYYLSIQLGSPAPRQVTIGVLFVSTAFFEVLTNPSDGLFASLSTLALAKLVAYSQRRKEADIWTGSLLLGLAVLARIEATVLIPALLVSVLLLAKPTPARPRLLAGSVVPGLAILAGYLLISRLTSPGLNSGIGGKSYDSFEVNQPNAGEGTDSDRRELARSLFGTQAENQGSVLRAIARNPAAFARRLMTNLGRLPDLYLLTFGKRLGPALLIFAGLGGYSMARMRRWTELGLLGIWLAPPLISLAFLPLHIIRQSSQLILITSALGLGSTLWDDLRKRGKHLPLFGASLLAGYGLLGAKLAFVTAGVVLGSALVLIRLTRSGLGEGAASRFRAAAFLLAAGLILRGSFPFPDYPPIGISPHEQVVHYLQGALPQESRILESVPLPALAAGMAEASWSSVPTGISTPGELGEWLETEAIEAVYIDSRADPRPELVALLEAGLDSQIRIGYQSENGELRVYLRSETADQLAIHRIVSFRVHSNLRAAGV